MTITRGDVAKIVDHTLLKPEATPQQIDELIRSGAELGVYAVCVSPSFVAYAKKGLPAGLKLATVCGFPSGKHVSSIKAAEAAQAVKDGADEVDMVIDRGLLKSGDVAGVQADIQAVRDATSSAVLKVIIESAELTDEEIVTASLLAQRVGADFVKTSTGFSPAGGASVAAVELIKRTVGVEQGIKASGGIRTWDQAVAMINAGATRLGLSATAEILAQGPAN